MKKWFEKHDLFKIVGLVILLTVLLSWVVKQSSFSGTEMVASEITRIGLNDFFTYGLLSLYYFAIIATFLLILGGFYQVLSKTKAYDKIVSSVTKFFKGKEIALVLITSLLFGIFTSVSNEVYQVLIFVPFVITVILSLKMDKITAFCATFGGVLIGLIGATYSQTILEYINYYLGVDFTSQVLAKFVLFFGTYILFNFFTIMRIVKKKSFKLFKSTEDDRFEVDVEEKENGKVWPLLVILGIVLLYQIIGYIDWAAVFKVEFFANWNTAILATTLGDLLLKLVIAAFGFGICTLVTYVVSLIRKKKFKLHIWPFILTGIALVVVLDVLSVSNLWSVYGIGFIEKVKTFLNDLTIGQFAFGTTPIFKYLLGTRTAMGEWDLYVIQGILILATAVIAWVYKIKFSNMVSSFGEGSKKMLKPILIVMMIYTICIFTVMFPVMPTIANAIMTLSGKFNVFLASLTAFVSSIFNVEMRYVASTLFTYMSTVYSTADKSLIAIIFQGFYGLVQFIAPTSLVLMLGLSYLEIPYKDWIKHIWMFMLGLLILVLGVICFIAFI